MIFSDPTDLASGNLLLLSVLFLAVLTALPIWYILAGWTQGRFDGLVTIGICLTYLLLVIGALWAPETTMWVRWICTLTLVGSFLYGLYALFSESHLAMPRLLKQNLEEYRATVEQDPQNIAARAKLAQTLWELGRKQEAIEHMEYAVSLARDPAIVADERRTLRDWQAEKRAEDLKIIRCPKCLAQNTEGMDTCYNCGEPLGRGGRALVWASSAQGMGIVTGLAGLLILWGIGTFFALQMKSPVNMLAGGCFGVAGLLFFFLRMK